MSVCPCIAAYAQRRKPTRCHLMVYYTYNMFNTFRALLSPSSGARDCMCVITAYGVRCLGWAPGPVWKISPHRDSIPEPSSPQSVAIPTELLGPDLQHPIKEKERAFRIILGPALGVRNPALIPAIQRPEEKGGRLAARGVPLILIFDPPPTPSTVSANFCY